MTRTRTVSREGGTDASARNLLLDAASSLMIERGTYDVSLHAIARAVGVTAPLIKYHFGSKDGLLFALVERDTRVPLKKLNELLSSPIDPLDKIKIHVHGILRIYACYPYLAGLFNEMLRKMDNAVSEQVRTEIVTPLINGQRAILQEGVQSGVLRPIDVDAAYFLIVGACQYMFASQVSFKRLMNGKPIENAFIDNFSEEATNFILRGLIARP